MSKDDAAHEHKELTTTNVNTETNTTTTAHTHGWRIYAYGVAACGLGTAFGWDTGSISGILTMKAFNEYFDHPSNSLQGGITASIQAGAAVSSLITGWLLVDRLGRKKSLQLGAFLFTAGIAICCAANNIYSLLCGRVLNGIGLGISAMVVPIYQAEISTPDIRGRLITLQQCSINLGILVSFLVQYGTSFLDGNKSWRIPFGLQMLPTIFVFCIMFFMPESPRWLITKDRDDEALSVLARVHAKGDVNNSYVLAEFDEIKTTLEIEAQIAKPSYYQVLCKKPHRRRTWIAISSQFIQQACGINACLYYSPMLFQQVGVGSNEASLLSNVIQGIVLNVLTLPMMYYLDTWGRRKPMYIGTVMMGSFMLLIGVLLKTTGRPYLDDTTNKVTFDFTHNAAAGKAVIAFLYLYVGSFAITWSSVAWVVPAEISTMATRATISSLTTATNWLTNLPLGLAIPTALERISYGIYLMFAGICFVASVVCFLFQVETANRTLEQMSSMFEEHKTAFAFKDRDQTEVHPSFAGVNEFNVEKGEV